MTADADDARRRRRDGVAGLGDGFHDVRHGRSGVLYYREGERVLELSYEMDGTRPGFLLYTGGLDAWVLPERSPTSAPDRERLRAALERWAGLQSTTITYVTADDLVRPWEDG